MTSMKTTLDKANKNYHFELFNNIVNEFSGKDFTTDDLMNEFFGIKNFTPKNAPKKVDPNKPKRAQSAYFIFSNDKRPELMEEAKKNGGKVDVTVVSKELGKLWTEMSDKKKKPYEKNKSFYKKIFSNKEIKYCIKFKNSYEKFAFYNHKND